MPDPIAPDPNVPIVKVSFDPLDDPQFRFDDETVRMTQPGIIVLIQRGGPRRWKFSGAVVKNDALNQFSAMPLGNGNTLVINDLLRDTRLERYSYNVTVIDHDGRTYQSPDPVIVNDPGTQGTV